MEEAENNQLQRDEDNVIPLQVIYIDLDCLFGEDSTESDQPPADETTCVAADQLPLGSGASNLTTENLLENQNSVEVAPPKKTMTTTTTTATCGTAFHTVLNGESITLHLNNADCVRELVCPENGARLYVVGTAHYSEQSQQDVSALIARLSPDCVVLELCAARTAILQMDEATLLDEASSRITVDRFRTLLRKHGGNVVQTVLECLLLHLSAHVTKQLGMAPGGEFRAAARAAHSLNRHASRSVVTTEVDGRQCRVLLGDRPIAITLRRAFATLSPWHKLKLLVMLVASSFESITPEQVEAFKQQDMLVEALRQLAGSQPQFSKVLLDERDAYLATSLRVAALDVLETDEHHSDSQSTDLSESSPGLESQSETTKCTVTRAQVVVGVVGLGHVDGIVRYWNAHERSAEMMRAVQPLMVVPRGRSRALPLFKWAVGLTLTAAAVQLAISIYASAGDS